jgi:hypothetical protein
MRLVLGSVAVLSLLCASNAAARTPCGAVTTDATAIATVESAIGAQCSCCLPRSAYAVCVASVVKTTVRAKQLSPSCVAKVRHDVGHACPLASTATTPCTVCGADSDCGAGAFCQYRSGSCTKAGGVCTAIPPVCPQVIAPVCGCDGTTYGNELPAAASGRVQAPQRSVRRDGRVFRSQRRPVYGKRVLTRRTLHRAERAVLAHVRHAAADGHLPRYDHRKVYD